MSQDQHPVPVQPDDTGAFLQWFQDGVRQFRLAWRLFLDQRVPVLCRIRPERGHSGTHRQAVGALDCGSVLSEKPDETFDDKGCLFSGSSRKQQEKLIPAVADGPVGGA